MRIILIESAVYNVSEKIYQELQAKQLEAAATPFALGKDVELELLEFIETLKPKFKFLGFVDFHFQL